MALSCSAQDHDSQEVLQLVFVFTRSHDYVSSRVKWLSIQSNGITAVVGPHTILSALHTHLACDLCVCVQERSSHPARTEDQDGKGRSEDYQQGFGG